MAKEQIQPHLLKKFEQTISSNIKVHGEAFHK